MTKIKNYLFAFVIALAIAITFIYVFIFATIQESERLEFGSWLKSGEVLNSDKTVC